MPTISNCAQTRIAFRLDGGLFCVFDTFFDLSPEDIRNRRYAKHFTYCKSCSAVIVGSVVRLVAEISTSEIAQGAMARINPAIPKTFVTRHLIVQLY